MTNSIYLGSKSTLFRGSQLPDNKASDQESITTLIPVWKGYRNYQWCILFFTSYTVAAENNNIYIFVLLHSLTVSVYIYLFFFTEYKYLYYSLYIPVYILTLYIFVLLQHSIYNWLNGLQDQKSSISFCFYLEVLSIATRSFIMNCGGDSSLFLHAAYLWNRDFVPVSALRNNLGSFVQ